MIWYIVIGIIVFTLFRFFQDYNKSSKSLQGIILSKKFGTLVQELNNAAFDGTGEVIDVDIREFQIYKENDNQIIQFVYGVDDLTIIWRYKYFQKEVVHERTFYNVMGWTEQQQKLIAEGYIKEMVQVVAKHKANILGL